jgi:spore maturation protein CgeB
VEKIRHYIEHSEERDRIATAGHIRTRDEHTYEMRFGRLFDAAMQLKDRLGNEQREINFKKYAEIEKKHAPGWMLRIIKYTLLLPCLAVWGRARGPRAARRILFELSWRLAGKKTYSVLGWPGRLFYRES